MLRFQIGILVSLGCDSVLVSLFNGSPKKNGNTAQMLCWIAEILDDNGIESEIVQVGGNLLHGCRDCLACMRNKDGRCSIDDDLLNEWVEQMKKSDGIVLGSPTYFCDVTPEMKALIDRGGRVARSSGMLKRKVGAGIVTARRMGAIHVYDTINHFFLINEMFVPGASYWNTGFGGAPGEVCDDEEAKKTMKTLADNMAYLLKKINE